MKDRTLTDACVARENRSSLKAGRNWSKEIQKRAGIADIHDIIRKMKIFASPVNSPFRSRLVLGQKIKVNLRANQRNGRGRGKTVCAGQGIFDMRSALRNSCKKERTDCMRF